MKKFKVGDKVKIKDGSYMTTKIDGEYKHNSSRIPAPGINQDIWEVMSFRKTPMRVFDAELRLEFDEETFNNMVVRNCNNGEIWNGRDDINFELVHQNIYPALYYNKKLKYHAYLFSEGVGYIVPSESNNKVTNTHSGTLIKSFNMDLLELSDYKLSYVLEK